MTEEKKKEKRDPVEPAVYIHVGAVLAFLGVVWFMFGILYALGGLVLATMFWIYWLNQQKERARAAKISEELQRKRQSGFQKPPPEMLGGAEGHGQHIE